MASYIKPQPGVINVGDYPIIRQTAPPPGALPGVSGVAHVKIADHRGVMAIYFVSSASETTKSWKCDRDYKLVGILSGANQVCVSKVPRTLASLTATEGIFVEQLIYLPNQYNLVDIEWPFWKDSSIYVTLPGSGKCTLLLRSVPEIFQFEKS